jgi:hypothetical protein
MTAKQLIALLCEPSGKPTRRDEQDACTVHQGFAGYPFSDDGYAFQARATSQTDPVLAPDRQPGLQIWPDVGDWPYLLYLRSHQERAIVEYCEGDLTVRLYDDQPTYQSAVTRLRAARPVA